MSPPAPMHNTRLFEKTSWSNPGILLWRSSAPGIPTPRKLIDVLDTVNAGCIIFHSFPVDFNFKVLIEPYEPHEAVTAEYGHDGKVPCALQAFLEVVICSRGLCSVGPLPRMAVEMRQKFVAKLFELDQQAVRGRHVGHNAQAVPALVGELNGLVEHQRTFDFRACDKEELLVRIGGQLFK